MNDHTVAPQEKTGPQPRLSGRAEVSVASLWLVTKEHHQHGTISSLAFQAACVGLLCQGGGGLPSSSVQRDAFGLR